MIPLGLTFKMEGVDKYGKDRQGELMLIHKCEGCGKISINRIAADDKVDIIMELFLESKNNSDLKKELESLGIKLLTAENEKEIRKQLYG